jgi:formylmethanofuran dehydrogenase subunit E
MEIDGYNDELKIGFEYQGIQHFSKQFYGTSLEQRILDDDMKAKLCSEHGIYLFLIDYRMEYQDFPKEIQKQAHQFGIDLSGYDFTSPADLSKAYIRDDRLPILKSILREKQITVLSTKWFGVKDKYSFRCEICGHEWMATGSHFFNSRKVGGCKKCSMAKLAGSNRLNLEEVQQFALNHGGICLSTEYGEIKQKYQFRCSQGHEFEDIYNNMKFRNTFCPTCENRTTKRFLSDKDALQILRDNNLEPQEERPKTLTQSWRSICLICGENTRISLQHLLDGRNACKFCAGTVISEKKARDVFAKAKLEPIEPFKTGSQPWKSKCLQCGSIVKGRYSNLVKGQGGCRTCYYARHRSKD